MDPVTIAVSTALAQAFAQVAKTIVDKGIIEPALDPTIEEIKDVISNPLTNASKKADVRTAVDNALKRTSEYFVSDNSFSSDLILIQLTQLKNVENERLRNLFARVVVSAPPSSNVIPSELLKGLHLPKSAEKVLIVFLSQLRKELYQLPQWQPLLNYANELAKLGRLEAMNASLDKLTDISADIHALLDVFSAQNGIESQQALEIAQSYREELKRKLRSHDFAGIARGGGKTVRLKLVDIYSEVKFNRYNFYPNRLNESKEESHNTLFYSARDVLTKSSQVVVLGEPGAGKTTFLKFCGLTMTVADGFERLRLERQFIPIIIRLSDFASELHQKPFLSLATFIFNYIDTAYSDHPQHAEFIQTALREHNCFILLDGLDEVGSERIRGDSLRIKVVEKVSGFSDTYCNPTFGTNGKTNRLIVTSRVEGYKAHPLSGFLHYQIAPLQVPGDVEKFLLKWFRAYEIYIDPSNSRLEAYKRAKIATEKLMSNIIDWPGIQKLITNRLLLTIVALIFDQLGKLPNNRINLYQRCTQTLMSSWRRQQTGTYAAYMSNLGDGTILRIFAALAFWLHENYTGGTTTYENIKARMIEILNEENQFEKPEIMAEMFLHHGRHQSGLISERGHNKYGFFHLTFEEYLAAREVARQRLETRKTLFNALWEDVHWKEVLRLAIAQLATIETRVNEASDHIDDLLKAKATSAKNEGKQVILAGRALLDVGEYALNKATVRWVKDLLFLVMQDRDLESNTLNNPPVYPVQTRYEAGELLDQLGWLPGDLNEWILCRDCGCDGEDLVVMKYPVTNAQFEVFISDGGYENPQYWGGVEGDGWQWRHNNRGSHRETYPISEPEYWLDPRLGKQRRGFPVVGVSWYEANAYAIWLTELLQNQHNERTESKIEKRKLIAELSKYRVGAIRLPYNQEWTKFAGGAQNNRYPWSPSDTTNQNGELDVKSNANTLSSGINGTSPCAMFPSGRSHPHGVFDLGGNTWEWTTIDKSNDSFALRGGAYYNYWKDVTVANAIKEFNKDSFYLSGFRLVATMASTEVPVLPPVSNL